MISVQIERGAAVVDVSREMSKAVKEGLKEGIQEATRILGRDVAEHTPSKTGAARREVIAERHRLSDDAGVVKYDYRTSAAFYMRFVLQGARPHRIFPKYQSSRGLKHAKKRGIEPKGALSFTHKGTPRMLGAVNHPGVTGRDILGERVTAKKSDMIQAIYASIERQMNRRR